jgi:hypothetical protein
VLREALGQALELSAELRLLFPELEALLPY